MAGEWRAVLARPVNVRVLADLEEQIELFREQRVVVFETQTEERIRLHEGAAAGDDLSTTMGDQVQSGKFLEDANRVSGAENGDGAREADVFRACGGRGQNHGRGGIEELGPVMFSDAEHVQTDSGRQARSLPADAACARRARG